ncbi:MAG TPA: DUF1177 domain-containing protein [Pseudothermotoga sp.]|nr:DUF1177 domain-containing protein [Pseudothermotoga sp.]HOK83499.1 DUF1177 domain-containing protein [Pseudothermotoga sp.]HPP69572.1 DUF1177 domain-containing protein [Pseudothermotoga sp.]
MLSQVESIMELLDDPRINGQVVCELFNKYRGVTADFETVITNRGKTDIVRITIEGRNETAPVLGIIGQLGGVGARPEMIGIVSDADGAIAALATALKISQMKEKGETLEGTVYVATHICPDAPTVEHKPVPFMDSPIGVGQVLKLMLNRHVDAVLSVDTTKGNRIAKRKGFAISPTVLKGYILRVADDLLDIYERVCGTMPFVLPITIQDITPYGNGVYHLNSIMQPCTITDVPVVGVAITTEVPVAGCATGASHEVDIELASRFCVEVAKYFGRGQINFYNKQEFERLQTLYGDLTFLVSGKECNG